MKTLQIAILILLVVVAGLLYMIYRGQTTQPAVAPAASETASAPAAPPSAPAALEAQPPSAPEQPAAAAPAVTPRPSTKRPSPTAERRTTAERAAQAPPAEIAQASGPSTAPAQPGAAAEASGTQPAPAAKVPLTPPSGTPSSPPAPPAPRKVTVPAGTLLTVRLTEGLSSEKNQAGDTFTATLDQPLIVEGLVLAERGARVEGRVLEVERAGRVRGLASMKIHLTRLHTSDGQVVEIRTEPFGKTAEASRGDDAKKIGIGAAVGAAIGAIAGGGKGAAIGAGAGGAAGTGTVLATRGKPVVLASETRLSFRLQEAVTLVEKVK